MKKKWAVSLSLLVLLLSLLPSIWQTYTVVAETLEPPGTKLITQEDLTVVSSVVATQQDNTWEVHYRFKASQTNEKRRLKFQFLNAQHQPIKVQAEKDWSVNEANQLIGTFKTNDEGTVKLVTAKETATVYLKVQADSRVTTNGKEEDKQDILSQDIAKVYQLTIPEAVKASDSSASMPSSNNSETVVSSQVSDSKTSTSAVEADATENSFGSNALLARTDASLSNALGADALYQNIAPDYQTDTTGTFPRNNWIPTGNQTVINHQGRKVGATDWDKNTSWDGNPFDKTNSYIEYGGTTGNPDFAIRKYAKETATPGLYDVYLNVKGNKQIKSKPMDIVLVVDMSTSMNKYSNNVSDRVGAVQKGITNFITTIKNNPTVAANVNIGLVGFSSPDGMRGATTISATGAVSEGLGKVSDSAHMTEFNKILYSKFEGGTYTQLGLREGTKLLQGSQNKKTMILLTDGVPTFSNQVTSASVDNGIVYGETFNYKNIDHPGYTSKFTQYDTSTIYDNNYNRLYSQNRDLYYYQLGGIRIQDTWAGTLGEARKTKATGVELHALGIQIRDDGSYLDSGQIATRMSLLASPNLYKPAKDEIEVQNYLEEQAKNVVSSFNTIVNGSISDPLGQQFVYEGDPGITDVNGNIANFDTLKGNLKVADRKLSLSNLNLGSGQEVQIHYQVRLNTETNDFVPNKWYQMNGPTTLVPNNNSPSNTVDFAVPSAKGPGTTLKFTKNWVEYDGVKTSRPSNVTYEVTRSSSVDQNAWKKGYITVEGNTTQDSWTKSTQQLALKAGDPVSVSLPVYNTNGVAFNYAVTAEATVPGYDSQINGLTVTNTKQFKPLTLAVTKTDSGGKKITGATFKLVDGKGNAITGTVDAAGSLFTYTNLKAGSYTLTEVKAPDGYVGLKNPIAIVISDKGTVTVDSQSAVVDNNTIQLSVKNQQKGLLPATGGSGRTGYWITGAILFSVMVLLALFYFLRRRQLLNKQSAKKSAKLSGSILVVLLTLPLGLGLVTPVKAATPEQPISFVLHKRVFKDSERLKTRENTGLPISPTGSADKDLVDGSITYGLNGVTFQVFDATQYVTDNLAKMSKSDLLKHVTNSDKDTLISELSPYQSKIGELITKADAGEDGVARLTVNPTSASSAYLFIETKLDPSDVNRVKMTATPMLVILPVENPIEKGTNLTTIHLYPKNTQIKVTTPPTLPPTKPKKPLPILPQTGEAKAVMGILGVLILGAVVLLWQKQTRTK
ncbi:pilin N-terminal domain-containing protein [Lactococcus paracarnosus]|uniref:VWA domain-containing protein n=1 Tax=Pseudolactococcus paracarnosus TaxID=2749962 RepID=A0ABT0AM95_9LACT|nr:pilin N-terminal domain-containing protein [Lactococcus paracarnosus]MCJ1977683.1 VWA domain-containing protein [Lactococcus paracarnosus]MCJ1983826.1 VWA domain-containing protein [Lactococcus paracarnosus]MCJ1997348.1 VWA domain-containing protein [Lactococcus paracarnosus]